MKKIKNTILVIGDPFAGVTTTATYLAQKFSIPHIMFGKDTLFGTSVESLVYNIERSAVIEKISTLKDIEFLKDQTHCVIFSITADQKIRHIRKQDKWGRIQPQTLEQFIAEEAKNIRPLISADYTIENNGTLDDLYKKLNELIATVDTRKLR